MNEQPYEFLTDDRFVALDEDVVELQSWPPRSPLPPLHEAMPIPTELLPEPLKTYVDDQSERLDVAAEMVAVSVLVSIGAIIGRQIAIAPKRYDSWFEFPTLWGLIIAPPSKRKSAALDAGDRFLRKFQSRFFAEHDLGKNSREAARTVAEAKLNAARKESSLNEDEITALVDELNRLNVNPRRLLSNDSTLERLQEIMRDNPNGILLRRDEIAGLLAGLERKGREGERQFYLEAWSGKGDFTADRMGRGMVHVPHACLSVLGTIQPAALARFLGNCTGDGGDGLLARFGMMVMPESSEPRLVDRTENVDATEAAQKLFDDLLDFQAERIVTGHERTPDGAVMLRFADGDAQELSLEWQRDIARAAHEESHPGLQAHLAKLPKTFAALAGILHIVEVLPGETAPGPITLRSAQRAAAWCDYLRTHAAKLYATANPQRAAMLLLAERIEHGEVADGITLRELYTRGWKGLKAEGVTRDALDALENLGWVRVEKVPTGPEGGRPSARIRIHPELRRLG